MKPGLLHHHIFKQYRIDDGEERKNRGLPLDRNEYWYERRCRCGKTDGEPYLGKRL